MAHEMTVDGVELMPDFPLLTRPTCPMLHLTASNSVRDVQTMTQAVVEHYQDHLGRLGYALFQAVQTTLFAGELPWPLILWGLTVHGHCLAWTRACDRPPMILLHPSLLGGTEKERPWGLPDGWLGVLYALDTLIHECMHVAVHSIRGEWQGGESSHNNPLWIAEVNRLAPLLGFPGERAAMSKPVREEGKLVRRCKDATMTFDAASRFPQGLRQERGPAAAYYLARRLPMAVTLPAPWRDTYHQPAPALPITMRNGHQERGRDA